MLVSSFVLGRLLRGLDLSEAMSGCDVFERRDPNCKQVGVESSRPAIDESTPRLPACLGRGCAMCMWPPVVARSGTSRGVIRCLRPKACR